MCCFVKALHFLTSASDDKNVQRCLFVSICDVCHLPLCPYSLSALSIWRVASWSAIPANSATSKSSREERWLRYSTGSQCNSVCFTAMCHMNLHVSLSLFRLCPWAQQLSSGGAKRCNPDNNETNVYLKIKVLLDKRGLCHIFWQVKSVGEAMNRNYSRK